MGTEETSVVREQYEQRHRGRKTLRLSLRAGKEADPVSPWQPAPIASSCLQASQAASQCGTRRCVCASLHQSLPAQWTQVLREAGWAGRRRRQIYGRVVRAR